MTVAQRPRAAYRPRRPVSRLAQIVLGVMASSNVNPTQLRQLMGWSKTHTYRVLTEFKHPMTVDHAQRILDVLGYALQHRAVPKGETCDGAESRDSRAVLADGESGAGGDAC